MALGDITVLQWGSPTGPGSRLYNVAASATTIKAGEPVSVTAGGVAVLPAATSTPVIGTDYYVGIAATTSTNTSGTAGIVGVYPIVPGTVYLISPKTATSWDTQSEYDALVGKRLTLDLTTGSYTINATDSTNNGCIVQAMSITDNPGKVAFQFRQAIKQD